MRAMIIFLLIILSGLQYKLWFGEDSFPKWKLLKQKLVVEEQQNNEKMTRNRALEADVAELKSGDQALEEQARYDLGMVKEDEAYYQFID